MSRSAKIRAIDKLLDLLAEWPLSQLAAHNRIKPLYINYSATDICNLRCTMCNIWQNKKSDELSLEEFEALVSSPLYRRVRHFGISGGEPFLVKDLPEKVEILVRRLPRLRSISFITNGSMTENCLASVERMKTVCRSRGVRLGIAVSIDGVGDLHDRVRGVSGSFEKASRTIDGLIAAGIHPEIFCTIVRENLAGLFDLDRWARSKKLSIKFRVATEIARLGNADRRGSFVRRGREAYEVAEFLSNLAVSPEAADARQRMIYRSIVGMLAYGADRKVGCYWQRLGVTLDASGNLYYCGVKSRPLGAGRTGASESVFYAPDNLAHREKIIREDCSRCIHDYKGPVSWPGLASLGVGDRWAKVLRKLDRGWALAECLALRLRTLLWRKHRHAAASQASKKILITGWYGTETAGDKAILGRLLEESLRDTEVEIKILSTEPFYTLKTLSELHRESDGRVTVVPWTGPSISQAIGWADEVVIGGGPLMNVGPIFHLERQILLAGLQKKKTSLYYCGVGPLGHSLYRSAINSILRRVDEIRVRDAASAAYVAKIRPDAPVKIDLDPAYYFVQKHGRDLSVATQTECAVFALRDWPEFYRGSLGAVAFEELKRKTFEGWVSAVRKVALEKKLRVVLLPMNTFHRGDDDRVFLDRVRAAAGLPEELVHLESESSDLNRVMAIFARSRLVVGMRFHSVVFGAALRKPVLACDYAVGGGKIEAFFASGVVSGEVLRLDRAEPEKIPQALDRLMDLSIQK